MGRSPSSRFGWRTGGNAGRQRILAGGEAVEGVVVVEPVAHYGVGAEDGRLDGWGSWFPPFHKERERMGHPILRAG